MFEQCQNQEKSDCHSSISSACISDLIGLMICKCVANDFFMLLNCKQDLGQGLIKSTFLIGSEFLRFENFYKIVKILTKSMKGLEKCAYLGIGFIS